MHRSLLTLVALGLLLVAGCRSLPVHQTPLPTPGELGQHVLNGASNIVESDLVTCILVPIAVVGYFVRQYP